MGQNNLFVQKLHCTAFSLLSTTAYFIIHKETTLSGSAYCKSRLQLQDQAFVCLMLSHLYVSVPPKLTQYKMIVNVVRWAF